MECCCHIWAGGRICYSNSTATVRNYFPAIKRNLSLYLYAFLFYLNFTVTPCLIAAE